MKTTLQLLNEENFDLFIYNGPLAIVDFYADWCGPCKAMQPVLEQAAKQYAGHAKIAKLNVDKWPHIADQFKVQSLPTLIYFVEGKAVARQVGAQTLSAIAKQIDKFKL